MPWGLIKVAPECVETKNMSVQKYNPVGGNILHKDLYVLDMHIKLRYMHGGVTDHWTGLYTGLTHCTFWGYLCYVCFCKPKAFREPSAHWIWGIIIGRENWFL